MKRWTIVAAIIALAGPARAYQDFSTTLSTAAKTVLPAVTSVKGQQRSRLVLINFDAAIDVWCRNKALVQGAATAHGVGSYRLGAGGGGWDIIGGPPNVYQGEINCVAESGAPVIFGEVYP